MLLSLTILSATAFGEDRVVVIPMMDEIKIGAPIEWKGQWQERASYVPGDGSQYVGSSYICIESHTASIDNAPPNSSFWSLMAAQGEKGESGETGAQGIQGPQGIVGPPGIPGPQGAKGDTGATGPQGLQGPKGDTGPQGVPGPVGDTGPQGIPGPVGATGPQGIPGPVGATGPQGIQGAAGTSGIQVYDANNQNLGTLLSLNDADNFFTIFNPEIDLTIRINKDTGELYKDGTVMGIYINTSYCNDTPSYVIPRSSLSGPITGLLVANPNQYSANNFPYTSYEYPLSTRVTVSQSARGSLDGGSNCIPQTGPAISGYRIIYYKNTDVPLTFPIAFPLRFETP